MVQISVWIDAETGLDGVAGALAGGCFEASVKAFVGRASLVGFERGGGVGFVTEYAVEDGGCSGPDGGFALAERFRGGSEEGGELLPEAGAGL